MGAAAVLPSRSAVALERQLIHRLALAEHMSYSELTNSLPKRLVELPEFADALARVACFVAPQGMSQGKYVLRREMWARFDAYFPLYSMQELHRAQAVSYTHLTLPTILLV